MNRGEGANRNANVNRGEGANRNANVNRDVNRNTNVDRNRDVDVHGGYGGYGYRGGGYGYGGGCCYHPVARAAAVTTAAVATAAVVGSVVNTLPSSCTTTMVNGLTYQQCGDSWYQPQISGSSTSYVVVNPPQ